MRLTCTLRSPHRSRHVVVDAHPLATLGELLQAAGMAGTPSIEGRTLAVTTTIEDAGLRDGSILGVDLRAPVTPAGCPEAPTLLVLGGPGAGRSVALEPGVYEIGRSRPVPLDDPDVSRSHLGLTVGGEGTVSVVDLGSANGTWVNGAPLSGPRTLAPGELIRIGRSVLTVAPAPPADAALHPDAEGHLLYSRPPRLRPADSVTKVSIPAPPGEAERPPFPLLAVLAPVAMGVLMAVLLHNYLYLAFTALSPVMVIGNTVSERRRGASSYRSRLADYERRREEARDAIASACRRELAQLRLRHPDPATALLIATLPSSRLWERQRLDPDFLTLRVGTGSIPANIEVSVPAGAEAEQVPHLPEAPVTIPLAECGAVGLCGPRAEVTALARSMLTELVATHSPRDVALLLATHPDRDPDWDWVRWLPHARLAEGREPVARVANDSDTLLERLAEIEALLEARRAARTPGSRQPTWGSVVVAVLDDSYRLRLEADLGPLLREGPSLGVYALCLDDTPARVPEVCGAVVAITEVDGEPCATLRRTGAPDLSDLRPDGVSVACIEQLARALAPIRDAGAQEGAAALPADVRFLDLAGLEPPTPPGILASWSPTGRTTRATVGLTTEGPFVLDLGQGPHALVAGTTGAGKSEFLQTLVAALAVGNRPDAMNFVLIDYKGGAAFRGCTDLPHTVGMVTDLDAHLVERALTSLRAELQRRKAVLDAADKTNISRYWDSLTGAPDEDPLPRLVIVVDEFAGLASELPDFLHGLVDIAAQGRSLGVHLVLATQRPAGVVSAEMRANINLMIALRVSSDQDSMDVIGSPAAAKLPPVGAAGRGYARTGAGSRAVLFQTARVGGLRPGVRPKHADLTVVTLDWPDLGHPLPVPPPPAADPDDATDLSVLVTAVREAATTAGFAPARVPWAAPLPELVTLDQLDQRSPPDPGRSGGEDPGRLGLDAVGGRPTGTRRLVYGLHDRPRQQDQQPVALDLERGGHLLVVGAPKSGRTTLLRTLAAAAARDVPVENLHLFALDFGGGGLAGLAELPHCGAVVGPAQPDRVERLLARLTAEVSRRQTVLQAGGHADLVEYLTDCTPAQRMPFLLLLVDRYDSFATSFDSADGGRLVQDLQRLLANGLASGLHVVLTGDRSLASGRLASLVEDKLILRMADKADYVVAGLPAKSIPASMPAGRALQATSGDGVQIAIVGDDPAGAGQARALRELTRTVAPAPAGQRPLRVDALPASIGYAQALALPVTGEGLLVGVGGDELSQVRVSAPALLVVGPPGSGRSTALATLAMSQADAGSPLVVLLPRRSALPELIPGRALHAVLSGGDVTSADLPATLADLGPATIVVDDAELVNDAPIGEVLCSILRSARDSGHTVLAAATIDDVASSYRGFTTDIRRGKTGLILGAAHLAAGDLFGTRLPRSLLGNAAPLRAIVVRQGSVLGVQVPSLRGAQSPPGADRPVEGPAQPTRVRPTRLTKEAR